MSRSSRKRRSAQRGLPTRPVSNAPVSTPAPRGVAWVLLTLFFLSGFSGLVYEIAWMKLLTPVVGAALFSVTAVLTVFMGGLALGSLVGGRYLERATSALRYSSTRRRRRALPMTETELRLIAALAIIGLSRMPKNG